MLPTEKNTPGLDPLNKKMLVHGARKVGKSTLVHRLFPNALFIQADPTGLEELEVFKVDCRSWTEFRQIGSEIAAHIRKCEQDDEPPYYEAIVVDTVDEIVRHCRHDVLGKLTGGPTGRGTDDFLHESDWGYGKAWNAVTEEFRLRVAKLCNLGLPVVFVSHSKATMKTKPSGLEITVHQPDFGGGPRDWLTGFVDYIFFAEVIATPEGERRVLRTVPSESYLAGARQPEGKPLLPDTLPLDGARLRRALEATAVTSAEADAASARKAGDPPGDSRDTGHAESPVEVEAPKPKTKAKAKAKPAKAKATA